MKQKMIFWAKLTNDDLGDYCNSLIDKGWRIKEIVPNRTENKILVSAYILLEKEK